MNRKKEKYWLAIVDAILALLLGVLLLLGFRSCGRPMTPSLPDKFDNDEVNDSRIPPAEVINVQDSTDTSVREAEAVGESGDLKVTLLWDFPGDIDLHVVQPNGRQIYYQHKHDRSTGGYLDVDNTAGGNGSAENVYWETPLPGTYKVFLYYYQPSSDNGQAGEGDCTVVVFRKGAAPETLRVHMSRVHEKADVTAFTID